MNKKIKKIGSNAINGLSDVRVILIILCGFLMVTGCSDDDDAPPTTTTKKVEETEEDEETEEGETLTADADSKREAFFNARNAQLNGTGTLDAVDAAAKLAVESAQSARDAAVVEVSEEPSTYVVPVFP